MKALSAESPGYRRHVSVRYVLCAPGGETVVRGVLEGRWVEPASEADSTVGADLFAIPGLVDGHAHFAKETMDRLPGDIAGAGRRAREALRAGVTLALDKGWMDLATVEMIDRVPASERPTIEAAGIMNAVDGGYFPGFAREVPDGGIEAVVATAAKEAKGWVKLVGDWPRKGRGPLPNFTEQELESAVDVAVASGARVAVHTMAPEVPSMAVRAGVHSIEHGLFLTEEDLGPLGARAGMWVPTVLNVESLVTMLGPESTGGRLMLEGLANITRLMPLAVEAGVLILAGTDMAVPTSEVGKEAVRLQELGLPRADALRAVSTAGFAATGRASGFEIGSPADVAFFAADPLDDLGVLGFPRRVLRMGQVVS